MRKRPFAVLAIASAALLAPPLTGAVATNEAGVRHVLGPSLRHRPISVVVRGDADSPNKELVVGCIHGNEPAGIAIARRLESIPLPRGAGLWIVEDANPDGVAADTRTNADGVDLNRNFPWHWRRHARRGDPYYSGPHPLSEPESRLLDNLIRRIHPHVTIWFHQPYDVVDESGGDLRLERKFASLVGLPLRRLPRFGGGATDWQNARFPNATAFVVELPQRLPRRAVSRYARAALALVAR